TCHVGGERGPLFSSSHQRVGHRYTSRTAPAEPEVVTGALGACARWPIGRARRVTKTSDHRRTHSPVAAVPGVTHFVPSVAPLAQTNAAWLRSLVRDFAKAKNRPMSKSGS